MPNPLMTRTSQVSHKSNKHKAAPSFVLDVCYLQLLARAQRILSGDNIRRPPACLPPPPQTRTFITSV